eukprot:PhF_6_TR5145/c0_g1_i1/m.7350
MIRHHLFFYTFLLTFLEHSTSTQPTTGNAQEWYASSNDNPTDIAYDSTNTKMYFSLNADCTIRSSTYYSETTAITIGATTDCSDADDASATTARVNKPVGLVFKSDVLYITMEHKVKTYTVSTGAVATYAGGSSFGSDTNCDKLAATFRSPHGIRDSFSTFFIADYGNTKIRRISQVSLIVSDLATVTTPQNIWSIAIYKGYLFTTQTTVTTLYRLNIRNGFGEAYLDFGQVIYSLYYDCYRRTLYLGQEKQVKSYHMEKRTTTVVCGDGSTVTPIPSSLTVAAAGSYIIQNVQCVNVISNTMFGCSDSHKRIFIVGIDSTPVTSCIATASLSSRSYSDEITKTMTQTDSLSDSRSMFTDTRSNTNEFSDTLKLTKSRSRSLMTETVTNDFSDTLKLTKSRSRSMMTETFSDSKSITNEFSDTLKFTKSRSRSKFTETFSDTKSITDDATKT